MMPTPAFYNKSKGADVNRNEFVQLLVREYAAEGENVLVARQTPTLDAEGKLQFYSDGAVKAKWPCMVVNPKLNRSKDWKNEGAWYTHIALFSGDRALRQDAICNIMMVLDDIGTKSKTPPLDPTYKLETSPGNFQWGYFLQDTVEPDTYAAAINAMARCGYTDAGAINPVRKVRLPGSINLKPKANGFVARLTHFEAVGFDLDEILEACGVSVTDADCSSVTSYNPVRLKDDGSDTVLAWLSDRNQVYSTASSDGWYDVLCPNHSEHTDGSPCGRYLPATRAYMCFHGHCQHIDSAAFLRSVAEQGGPQATTGLREELMTAPLKAAAPKMEAIREAAAAVEVEGAKEALLFDAEQDAYKQAEKIERQQIARDDINAIRQDWFRRYCYVRAEDGYFDMERQICSTRTAFNAEWQHIRCVTRHADKSKPGRISPATWFDEQREDNGGQIVEGVTYAAGDGVIVEHDGNKYANKWREGRPALRVSDSAEPWLAHMRRMIPDDTERQYVLDWMAFKIQNPRVKINWQLYWGSKPGAGKDTAIEPFLHALAGAAVKRRNVTTVDLSDLESGWTYFVESELIICNEIREPFIRARRELENKLKPLAATPPLMLTARRKGEHPVEVPNRCGVLLMSNYRDGLTLPHDDRRWMVIWSDADTLSQREASVLWAWYDAGGRDAVTTYLHALDVSQFNPKAAAPWTDAKAILCGESLSDAEEYVVHMARDLKGGFAKGLVATPFTKLIEDLNLQAPAGLNLKVTRQHVQYAIQHAGWESQGLCTCANGAGSAMTKRHIYTAPGMHTERSKSDLRRMCDDVRDEKEQPSALKLAVSNP